MSLVVACSDPDDPDRADAGPEDAGCVPSVPTFAELTLHEATLRWDGGSAGCRAIPLDDDRYEVTGEERDVDAGYFSRRSAFWVRNPSFYEYELWVSASDELTVACDQTNNVGPNYYGTKVHISRLALTARTPQGWTFQGSGLLSELDGGVTDFRGCGPANPCPRVETHLDGGTYVEAWAELRREDGGVCAPVAP